MTERDLLKQALEALESPVDAMWQVRREDVITALRERLAQPEQEPVVWMYQDKSTHEVRFQKHMRGFVDHGATYETPLYTTPPPREWVGLTDEDMVMCESEEDVRFVRAIEAKLKEKNS